jgi:hypothetical protein
MNLLKKHLSKNSIAGKLLEVRKKGCKKSEMRRREEKRREDECRK